MAGRSVTCVVQARTGSTRLPGKVLADLGGAPMLAFLLRRLAPLDVGHLVVATTDQAADDSVAEVAEAEGAEVVRGPEADVLARFALALDKFPAEAIVRITGDCPLADPALVGRALRVWEESGADYVSNTLVRTFPEGLDVEVIAGEAMRAAAEQAADPVEREHVTPFVYRRPERFRLRSFRHHEWLGDLRWSVDTAEHLEFVRDVVGRLGRTAFGWEDVLALVPPPGRAANGWSFQPVGADDARVVLALRNDPESVRWSHDPHPVEPDRHAAWYASVLDDPTTRIWLAREDARVVGLVRIDVENGVGSVSIAVSRAGRGQGVGTRMLACLMDALQADEQVHTLVADVHEENEASRRLFARSGFSEVSREGEFLRVRRLRRAMSLSEPVPTPRRRPREGRSG